MGHLRRLSQRYPTSTHDGFWPLGPWEPDPPLTLKSRSLMAWLQLFKTRARPKPSWSHHFGLAQLGLFWLAWLGLRPGWAQPYSSLCWALKDWHNNLTVSLLVKCLLYTFWCLETFLLLLSPTLRWNTLPNRFIMPWKLHYFFLFFLPSCN